MCRSCAPRTRGKPLADARVALLVAHAHAKQHCLPPFAARLLSVVLRGPRSTRIERGSRQHDALLNPTLRRHFGSASRRSERTAAPAAMKRLAMPWLGRTSLFLACDPSVSRRDTRYEYRFSYYIVSFLCNRTSRTVPRINVSYARVYNVVHAPTHITSCTRYL